MWRLFVWACVWGCACAMAAADIKLLRWKEPDCSCKGVLWHPNEYTCSLKGGLTVTYAVESNFLYMNCHGAAVLDSSAMPTFRSTLHVHSIRLQRCPPPGTGRSYADIFTALNVTLLQTETQGNLSLYWQPREPSLTAHHFNGLEHLVDLKITPYAELISANSGFLSKLRSLRSLQLESVLLPAGELDDPPATLRHLSLEYTGLAQLPEAVMTLPYLETVNLEVNMPVNFTNPSKYLRMLILGSRNTTMKVENISALVPLVLKTWGEKRPVALTQCNALKELELWYPRIEVLPERWVMACSRLERVKVAKSRLTSLPPNLFEGANALAELSFRYNELATLPVGLFDGLYNLRKLDLRGNHLHMLPSGVFSKLQALQKLDLSLNDLSDEVLDEVAALNDLTDLNLSGSVRIGSACDFSGYSRLRKLNKLKTLFLHETSITHICRDWRENMTVLEHLILSNTKISQLRYEDLLYTREDTVIPNVDLTGAPITSLRLTEDDYKKSLTVPKPKIHFFMSAKLDCNCNMYWTWLALRHENSTIKFISVKCASGRGFLDFLTKDELCPDTDITDNE